MSIVYGEKWPFSETVIQMYYPKINRVVFYNKDPHDVIFETDVVAVWRIKNLK